MNDKVYLKAIMSVPNMPEPEHRKMVTHKERVDKFAEKLGLDIELPEGL